MDNRIRLLRDSLTVLAGNADEQLRHLERIGVPENIDELALEFDDIGAACESMFHVGELDKKQRDCIEKLNHLLKRMGGEANSYLWTPDALRSAPEWKEIRTTANKCLTLLGRT